MTVLVVGYGSIGMRHVNVLGSLGARVGVVSRRTVDYPIVYKTITEALQKEEPDYVVIANNTDEHKDALQELIVCHYTGLVLVEKPIFEHYYQIPENKFKGMYVGYNLRFHPILLHLYSLLKNAKIFSVHVYVGQYLPSWRPNCDYRTSYSARRSCGGGVIRDLSHELDYISWMLGDWKRVVGLGGKVSTLEIDSDDIFSLLMVTKRCPVVNIQMDYLDRIIRRQIVINTDQATIQADLITGCLQINDVVQHFQLNRNDTYRLQHEAVMGGKQEFLCTADAGLKVLKLIESAEISMKGKRWVDQ